MVMDFVKSRLAGLKSLGGEGGGDLLGGDMDTGQLMKIFLLQNSLKGLQQGGIDNLASSLLPLLLMLDGKKKAGDAVSSAVTALDRNKKAVPMDGHTGGPATLPQEEIPLRMGTPQEAMGGMFTTDVGPMYAAGGNNTPMLDQMLPGSAAPNVDWGIKDHIIKQIFGGMQ